MWSSNSLYSLSSPSSDAAIPGNSGLRVFDPGKIALTSLSGCQLEWEDKKETLARQNGPNN